MTHKILPGSFEVDSGIITAGVHTGPSEWEIKNLRYVQGDITKAAPSETTVSFLSRVYDNSEGCLIKGSFKMKEYV
jgi:hypothetical protein